MKALIFWPENRQASGRFYSALLSPKIMAESRGQERPYGRRVLKVEDAKTVVLIHTSEILNKVFDDHKFDYDTKE